MINNGTLHYDHDRDGTHSQIAGCSVSLLHKSSLVKMVLCVMAVLVCMYMHVQVKFRNPQHETFVAISYINRRITVSDSAAHSYVTELCSYITGTD